MRVFLGTLFLCVLFLGSEGAREQKNFNVLQLVRFRNEPCTATNNNPGICYTNEECAQRGGAADGNCALGFGICCVFERTCLQTTNENCTIFIPPTGGLTATTTECGLEVCPCGDNVCQLRLDFNTFVITGPSTDPQSTVLLNNGVAAVTDVIVGGVPVTGAPAGNRGQCLTDTFTATSPGGGGVSPICGMLTGEHLYVDMSSGGACNNLGFNFLNTPIGVAALANRDFNIKVTQIPCDSPVRAPEGCTQYFLDPTGTGSVMTFNYPYQHLANQNQNICVRREGNNCRICWSATGAEFQLSGDNAAMSRNNGACCGYGNNGFQGAASGYDCVLIPNPQTVNGAAIEIPQFCGRGNGLVNTDGNQTPMTVCSTSIPFSIRFLSDQYEWTTENVVTKDIGARLTYFQDTTNC